MLALSTLFSPLDTFLISVQLVKTSVSASRESDVFVLVVVLPSAVINQHCRPVQGVFRYMFMVSRSVFVSSEEYNCRAHGKKSGTRIQR